MLLFILLKVKPLVSSRELEHCDPAGISSAPSTAAARTAPKQQSRPSGGNFRLCPEHSLVQLKPLAGSEAMSWLSEGLGFVAHTLNSSTTQNWCAAWAGFWSCLIKTRYSLGVLREGNQPLSIGRRRCSSDSSRYRSQIENVIILINFISGTHLFSHKQQFPSRPPAPFAQSSGFISLRGMLATQALVVQTRTLEDSGSCWPVEISAFANSLPPLQAGSVRSSRTFSGSSGLDAINCEALALNIQLGGQFCFNTQTLMAEDEQAASPICKRNLTNNPSMLQGKQERVGADRCFALWRWLKLGANWQEATHSFCPCLWS